METKAGLNACSMQAANILSECRQCFVESNFLILRLQVKLKQGADNPGEGVGDRNNPWSESMLNSEQQ